jgi:biopolymer transport protein ExbD
VKSHYIAREPALFLPFVALTANLLLLLFIGDQVQMASGRINLALNEKTTVAGAELVISQTGTASLNGSPMSSVQELQFHLSALSANSNRLAVITPPNIPAQRLAEILQACNRAGFTNIALSVAAAKP